MRLAEYQPAAGPDGQPGLRRSCIACGMPSAGTGVTVRVRSQAEEKVVGVVFRTGMQNVPGGELQG
jgi:hypothetical protein